MRSSIACSYCRKSKIKCLNSGTSTICGPCKTNHRVCIYPSPAVGASSSSKRTEPASGIRNDGETEVKRARKKEPESGRKHSLRDDPLEAPPITFKLWREIYSQFTLHFSTDLPFLHEATFFDRIKAQEASPRSAETELFLLGMLCLTARHIPELASFPYPYTPSAKSGLKPGDPLIASEYYAHALEARLDAVTLATPSLDTIHALLTLGVHSWSMCRGMRSWMWIGIATRLAYAMGLSTEDQDPDDQGKSTSVSIDEAKKLGVSLKHVKPRPIPDSQAFIAREINRRTMWSCFVLDRYLSSGRARPQMDVNSLSIQLPCSEEDFRFGTNVKTAFLREGGELGSYDDGSNPRRIQADTGSVLSIYIRLVEIWGGFSKWSCAGGRRTETYPPWEETSQFYKLRKQLDDFQASLPPKFTFTPTNLAAHVGGTTMTAYTAIHTLYSLCQIVLHREYIPFIPLRCEGPMGPLDEPTFPKEKFEVPSGFWEESAEHIFKSARDITEIVRANDGRGFSIESPQVAFAVWTSAFCGVYAWNFPHMDTGTYMCRDQPNTNFGDGEKRWRGATALAAKTLEQMSPKMRMASGWMETIKRMNEYFQGIIQDYNQSRYAKSEHGNRPSTVTNDGPPSLRNGGPGGGLAEYKLLESKLKDFGSIAEDERHPTPVDDTEKSGSRASTAGRGLTPDARGEGMQGTERSYSARPTTEGTWASVNKNPANENDDYSQRSSPLLFKPHGNPGGSIASQEMVYHQQQNRGQASNPPSLMSPQSVQSSLSSPYGRSEHPGINLADSTYASDAVQQISSFASVAQHAQPLLTSQHDPVDGPTYNLDPNFPQTQEAWLKPLEGIVLGGRRIAGFEDGIPYNMWGDNPQMADTNFMQVLWPQHHFFGSGMG